MNSYLQCLTYHLPEKVLTNDDLRKEFPGWNIDELYHSTGIYKRHIAAKNEIPSDLAVAAAEKLFAGYGIEREEIDFIIFCTQSNDYYLPTTACIIQDRLNIKRFPGAIDINQGCTGFIYGLSVADGLVQSGAAEKILLLVAETSTHYVYHKDKSSRFVFGDGAAACIVSKHADNKSFKIGSFVLGSDGKGSSKIIVKYGGARYPVEEMQDEEYSDEYGNIRSERSLYLDGNAVFMFSLKTVPMMVNRLLEKSGYSKEDIDIFAFHQASKITLETLRNKLKIPEKKMIIDIMDYGNTASSSIPIVLTNAIEHGKIKKGDKILLASFGVGFSWASTIITAVT